ncbi:hypothetical protein MZL57_002779 [Acinetobacter baumannii]|nr:hypothetical protein [Acinetobacter baumannii]
MAGFSYASFVVDNIDNSSLSAVMRVVLIFFMIFIRSLIGRFSKVDIAVYFFCAVLLATLNPFFSIVAFMVIVGLIFSDFINIKYVVNIANFISIVCFLTILSMSFMGLSHNYTFYDVSEYAKSVRYSLGFANPNATSMYIVQTIIIFFIYRNNFGKFISIILGGVTIYYSASRTAFFVLICFLIMFFFISSNTIIKIMKWCALIFLLLVPAFLELFVAKGVWTIGGYDLNQLLSGRLSIIQEFYFSNGGISIFPSYDDSPLDSGLANIILKGGLIFYFIFIFICYFYLRNEKNKFFVFLFFTFLMLLISENFITGNMLLSILIVSRLIFLLKQENVKLIGVFE